MTLHARFIPLLIVYPLAISAAYAQDATVIGKDMILPGTGPGTTADGSSGGGLMKASSVLAATRRQGLEPATVLASSVIGVEVRNLAGGNVGTIEDVLISDGGTLKALILKVGGFMGLGGKRIAIEPGALILRPGGERYAAVLAMSDDTIAAAQPFDTTKIVLTR